jgi:predicted DsbA family dithiol-disulfide isomerase
MFEHLRTTANELGLPFGTRTRTYNSRLAQELGLWAAAKGRGEAFHLAAFMAYFVDGQNLAERPVLLDIARSTGLDEEEAGEVIDGRGYRPQVDNDWQESRRRGITAVPTLAVGQDLLVGAQNFEEMVKLVSRHGAVRRRQAKESP